MRSWRFLPLLALAACGGGGSNPDADVADVVDADGDIEETVDVPDAEPDMSEADDGEAEADVPPPDPCTVLGLPERPWDDSGTGQALYGVAADLTLDTWDGPWVFSEQWSGCDVYLFIQDEPAQDARYDWPTPLWEGDVLALLRRSPRNAQLFFVSTSGAVVTRNNRLVALQTVVQAVLAAMSAEDQAWWTPRIHYLPGRALDQPAWLGSLMASPGWGVGVDRLQRIRYIGSYADYGRYDSGRGWFAPNLAMVANEARYYNFEATREERLAAEDATVVHVLTGEVVSDPGWAGARTAVDVVLPDAATMATFDTLELDYYAGCVGDGEFGDCPAWDYINELKLCDAAAPDTCTIEIGRWITTYHREGRWVHDVSALLPLLADGGTRRFSFYSQQPYEVTLDLRLSDQGKPSRPEELVPLFTGGALDVLSAPATSPAPITVAIPADAAKVELATVLSGHGGVLPENCAEFCDVNHHFLVNGHDNLRDFPDAGRGTDCMEQVDVGTVPNQYGTWWYSRGGWCPGLEVPLVMLDVTSQVTLGADNVFEYQVDFAGSPYIPGGANIDLVSWLVISR
jgi:hypothetical protein